MVGTMTVKVNGLKNVAKTVLLDYILWGVGGDAKDRKTRDIEHSIHHYFFHSLCSRLIIMLQRIVQRQIWTVTS